WGGWYVTGSSGAIRHRGNEAAAIGARQHGDTPTMRGLFEEDGYQAMSSDIAALLVLSHQVHMTNLLTRAGWEARAADPAPHPPLVGAPRGGARLAQMMSGTRPE